MVGSKAKKGCILWFLLEGSPPVACPAYEDCFSASFFVQLGSSFCPTADPLGSLIVPDGICFVGMTVLQLCPKRQPREYKLIYIKKRNDKTVQQYFIQSLM